MLLLLELHFVYFLFFPYLNTINHILNLKNGLMIRLILGLKRMQLVSEEIVSNHPPLIFREAKKIFRGASI